jgi:hypothetical protein
MASGASSGLGPALAIARIGTPRSFLPRAFGDASRRHAKIRGRAGPLVLAAAGSGHDADEDAGHGSEKAHWLTPSVRLEKAIEAIRLIIQCR